MSDARLVEAGTGPAHLLLGQVIRTLVAAGELAFVAMAGPKSGPIPMHRHGEAHDVFYCERGAIQVWFDGESRVLYPGDLASIPPGTLHAYALLRADSRSVGPITPGGWERFFAFVGQPYDGPAFPPEDHSPPPFAKFAQAEQEFDTVYVRDAPYPAATDGPDDRLPGTATPYVLKAGEGERHLLDGVVSRPLITAAESGGAFGFEELAGPRGARVAARRHESHEVLYVLGGRVRVGDLIASAGDTLSIPAGVEHDVRLEGAETRWLATYAPAGPERLSRDRGQPWPHEIFPALGD